MCTRKGVITALLIFFAVVCFANDTPQLSSVFTRQMERLDRGLVAVKTDGGVFLSWRLLGDDAKDVRFNIYRNNVLLNTTPLTGATNYTDTLGAATHTYQVGVVDGSTLEETQRTEAVTPWGTIYKTLPLDRPEATATATYSPGDCSVGDLDGDGTYEIVVKWDPSNAKDNASSGITDKVYLDAYKLDGTKLWRIDLGINIRAGAHYTQFMVYDLDGDGRAEVACKTAPGTMDGQGRYVLMGSDKPTANYRNSSGYILSGPEYLTVFDGLTGANLSTVAYNPPRGTVSAWGDSYGNRVDRFLACIAYLDGVRPSLVMCRGYYTRSTLAAWDYRDGKLVQRWFHDSATPGQGAYGEGNHNLSVADVDGDGFDEIIYGSACIDHNGKTKYRTGLGHGDAMHVSDLDPDRPGLEVFQVHESTNAGKWNHEMHDANTGSIIFHSANYASDNGRGIAADIDPRYRGFEMWSVGEAGMYDTKGNQFAINKPTTAGGGDTYNQRIYWDGDLQDEMLDRSVITKWNIDGGTGRLITLYNYGGGFINGTKENPNLSADIIGDWREEVICNGGNTSLIIFTTTAPTTHRLYTLMHDPVYRLGVAWQNVAYNQPPHLGFYIGDGVDSIPYPNLTTQPLSPSSSELKLTIRAAKALLESATPGIDMLQYPPVAYDAYSAIIDTAQTFFNKLSSQTTQTEVDSLLSLLTSSMDTFIAAQNRVLSRPDSTVYYAIYSYGVSGGSQIAATPDMTKKYITATPAGKLSYLTGSTDANDSYNDTIRTNPAAQWIVLPSTDKEGYVTIRNRATNMYLQILSSMVETPVDVHVLYRKTENGKMACSIQESDSTLKCLQLFSTAVSSTRYIDRVQMRWVFEPAAPITALIHPTIDSNDPVVSVRYYTLQGIQQVAPEKPGLYIQVTTHQSGAIHSKKFVLTAH
ncbi:MAG: rhamnogalacturonan lyase [Bacteroidales bacterium]|nr:rhamnogalacturonan lyase [Bacteroidales bacterium]